MNRRRLLGLLGVGVAAGSMGARRSEAAIPVPLDVRIVPTSYREEVGRAIRFGPTSPHFHVVVTNISDKPVRLWREWCSWGYFNLSFDVTDESGRSVTVRKRERVWHKNWPDWDVISPGGHQVREVTFDPETWIDTPLLDLKGREVIRMKAVYSIRPDEKSEEHAVWTGHVSSPEDSYTLWPAPAKQEGN